jgi:hypothetical protein
MPESPSFPDLVRQARVGDDGAAAEVGGQPDALRKKLSRAVGRVLQELGLEEGSDE